MKTSTLVTLFFILLPCVAGAHTSWERLASHRTELNGNFISIEGVFCIELDEDGKMFFQLWKSRDAFDFGAFESCLRLDQESFAAYLRDVQPNPNMWWRWHMRHVQVKATFVYVEDAEPYEMGGLKLPTSIAVLGVHFIPLNPFAPEPDPSSEP